MRRDEVSRAKPCQTFLEELWEEEIVRSLLQMLRIGGSHSPEFHQVTLLHLDGNFVCFC
jgi:hypothetical protein